MLFSEQLSRSALRVARTFAQIFRIAIRMSSSLRNPIALIVAITFALLVLVLDFRGFDQSRTQAQAAFAAFQVTSSMKNEDQIMSPIELGEIITNLPGGFFPEDGDAESVLTSLQSQLSELPIFGLQPRHVFDSDRCSYAIVPAYPSSTSTVLQLYSENTQTREWEILPLPTCFSRPIYMPKSVVVSEVSQSILGYYFDRRIADLLHVSKFSDVCSSLDRCKIADEIFATDTPLGYLEAYDRWMNKNHQNLAFIDTNLVDFWLRVSSGQDDFESLDDQVLEDELRRTVGLKRELVLLGTPIPISYVPAVAAWLVLALNLTLCLNAFVQSEWPNQKLDRMFFGFAYWGFFAAYLLASCLLPLLVLESYRPTVFGLNFSPVTLEFFESEELWRRRLVTRLTVLNHGVVALLVLLASTCCSIFICFKILRTRIE